MDFIGNAMAIFAAILFAIGWILLMIAWGLVVTAIFITIGMGLKKLWQARK